MHNFQRHLITKTFKENPSLKQELIKTSNLDDLSSKTKLHVDFLKAHLSLIKML